MSTSQQQREAYVLPPDDAESERLERQAQLYGGVRFLEPLLDVSLSRVLDAGCGTGFFTRHVAARVPSATVVGLDLEGARLGFGQARAALGNLRFGLGDLGRLPLADDSVDLAFCRFVLVHDRDPSAALAELARVTRPGGRVVAYDMIHEGIWFSPPKPSLSRLLATTLDVLRENGAEPNQGLHLPVALRRAGLKDVQVEVLAHSAISGDGLFEGYRLNWLDTVDSLTERLGERFAPGLAEAARAELVEAADGDHFHVEITVLAHGVVAGS